MRTHEFYNTGELEDASNQLARATENPLFVDTTQQYHGGEEEQVDKQLAADDISWQDDVKAIWNNRDNRLAYIGSRDYNLIQHREVIDMIRDAVADTTGEIDFGMIRDYGEKIDGLLVFGNQEKGLIDLEDLLGSSYIPPDERPDTDKRAEGTQFRDAVGLGMRFGNSFDGGRRVSGSTMGYRYVCQNWMVWDETEIGSVDSVHLGELDEDFFADIIEELFEVKSDMETIIVEGEEQEVPLTWAPQVLADAGFGRNHKKAIVKILNEYEHVDDETTTLWRIYNAATDYLDNHKVQDVGNGVYNKHQQRAWNILTMNTIEEPEEEPENLAEVT